MVGRPGLDPGTLGLKGTYEVLLCVGLVAHVVCFQGNALSPVGLVSWCCRNMRPKMRPVLKRRVARSSFDHLLVTAGGFVSAK